MNDPRDGDVNPDVLLGRRDFKDLARMEYRKGRRQDPERRNAVEQAVRCYCGNPEEADHALAVVAQLERDENRAIGPDDVPGLVDAMRGGGDPREGLRAQQDDRQAKYRPTMSASQEDDEFHSAPQRTPFRQACLGSSGISVTWSASLQTAGFEFTLGIPSCTSFNDSVHVQLSDNLHDWLEVNSPDNASRLCLALRAMDGKTLTLRDMLVLPIPADEGAVSRFEEILTTFPSRDHEQDLDGVVDQLDALVGPALGLDSADLAVIRKDTSIDPFLSKIYPRYPYTETCRHGFRTRLDRPDRYQ